MTKEGLKWQFRSKLCLLGTIFFATILLCSTAIYKESISDEIQRELTIFSASGLLGCVVIGLISWDIGSLEPATFNSLFSLLYVYFAIRVGTKIGKRIFEKFITNTRNVQKQQEKLLLDLLKENCNTAYGNANKLGEFNSVDEFRDSHPICTYEHYRPYIDRICEGETNVLTTGFPMFVARTSGTTGKCKLIPFTTGWRKGALSMVPMLMYAPVVKGVQLNLQKMFVLNFQPRIDSTKSGLKIGPMSHMLQTYHPFLSYPKVLFDITSERAAYYIHGVFLLREPHIGSMMFSFTNQAYSFFSFLEKHWLELCHDIEHGGLKDGLEIDDDLREQILVHLKADKPRAEFLRSAITDGNVGLVKRVWPGITYFRATGTGTMAVYTKPLLETYFKDVIALSGAYGGSEGLFGINTTPILNDPSYTLLYQHGFFEFLPVHQSGEPQLKDKTLLAHQLEVGSLYEVVLTNCLGLYRYRLGDVVKVESCINQCPVITVQYRLGQILNINNERIAESVFYEAIVKSATALDVAVVDYTACEDVYLYGMNALKDGSRKFVLFMEADKELSTQDKLKFDEYLQVESEPYSLARRQGKFLSAMEVYQVKPGTFEKLKAKIVEESGNSQQYKLPRALRRKELLQFLVDNQWV